MKDSDLLNFINDNSYDLVCLVYSGCEDSDCYWEIHAHHMTKPLVRVYGTGPDARSAIIAAMDHVRVHGDYAPCIYVTP